MGEKKRREAQGREPPLPFASLEEAWRLTATATLPPDMPESVRALLRRMFFMGAGAFFDMVIRNDPGDEPTEADLRKMDRLYAELEAFRQESVARVMAQKPPPGGGH